METTVWKEKCIGNKLNIYTSIQCVVSRGLTLGKLGISQSGDCTQWGIHSHFLLKWSQNNKQFWVDSFITQIVPIPHLVYTGQRAALQSLFLQQQFSNSFTFKKATSWSWKNRKRALRFSTNSTGFIRYYKDWGACGAATFPPLVKYGQLMPLLVMDRRYWSVRCWIGHESARSQRDL